MGHAADTDDVTKETLSLVRQLIKAVGRAVHVSTEGYLGLIRNHEGDPQAARRATEAITAKLAERQAKLSKLDLNFPLSVEEAERAGELHERLDAKKNWQVLV